MDITLNKNLYLEFKDGEVPVELSKFLDDSDNYKNKAFDKPTFHILRFPNNNIIIKGKDLSKGAALEKLDDDTYVLYLNMLDNEYEGCLVAKGSVIITLHLSNDFFKKVSWKTLLMPKGFRGISVLEKALYDIFLEDFPSSRIAISPIKLEEDSIGHHLLFDGKRMEGGFFTFYKKKEDQRGSDSFVGFYINESLDDNLSKFIEFLPSEKLNRKLPFEKYGIIGVKEIYGEDYDVEKLITRLTERVITLLEK